MKRFMLMHFGFEKPTPEIMASWREWFASVADKTVENAGLRSGREITRAGTSELAWDASSITGYTIINAESIEEAERIARGNPFISSVRVYEIASH